MSNEQLSYIYKQADNYLNYQTVPERMQQLAAENPDTDVYVFLYPDGKRESISAGTLLDKSKALARSLVKLGVKKGDVVATCLPNDKNALICTFGIICAGAVVAHLALRSKDGTDIQNKLNTLGAKYFILYPGAREEQLEACLNFVDQVHPDGSALSSKVPSLQMLIASSKVKEIELLQLDGLIREADNPDITLPRLDPDEVIFVISTSGSTGEPKFAPHSHRDSMAFGNQLKKSINYDENDVLYSERRIAWLGGFPFMFLHDGAKVVTLTEPIENFTDHVTFTYHALKTEKCTVACIFPGTVTGLRDRISNGPDCPLHTLKNIHITGVSLASSCLNAIGILTDTVTNCYGATEGGVYTSDNVTEKKTYVEFCAGKPEDGVEIKVIGTDGLVVERGQMGSIHVRSSYLSKFYYSVRNIKVPVPMTNGWMDTEDVGYVTKDGSLVIAGRKSEVEGVLYTGGRYVYGMSTYFEALIKEHPHVLDAVVVTVPDDVFGNLMCACVILLPDSKLSVDDLEDFCKSKMVSSADVWESSKMIMFFKKYPRLYTGKPNKRALREEAIQRK